MKDDDVKNRFIELRAQNWTYRRISTELKVSKQTLINWSRELSHAITNLRTIEFEELQAKHMALRDKRIELFGNILNQLSVELGKRALDQVSTEKILLLIIRYTEALKAEAQETVFQVEEETPVHNLFGSIKSVTRWPA